MHRPHSALLSLWLGVLGSVLGGSPARAQGQFATQVVQFSPGPNAGGQSPWSLGPPSGAGPSAGSLHVLSLGNGGSLVLGFGVTLVDGPGADLTVFENAFLTTGGIFAEALFVEVSTDGTQFARFPNAYHGLPGPLPAFGGTPWGSFFGMAGAVPCLADGTAQGPDPADPARSGGDSFDLADLAAHPLVLSGAVDPQAVHFVRLVDVIAGVDLDSTGLPIWDHGGTSSADVDAVCVVQHSGNQVPQGPRVDFYTDGQGIQHLDVSDPDGLQDLDWSSAHLTFDLVDVPLSDLRAVFPVVQSSSTTLRLMSSSVYSTTGPRAPGAGPVRIGLSLADQSGTRSGDTLFVPGP